MRIGACRRSVRKKQRREVALESVWLVLHVDKCRGLYLYAADALALGVVWSSLGIWNPRSVNGYCDGGLLDGA